MPRSISVILVLFLSGCAVLSDFHQRQQGNENSTYYTVAVESKLVLNRRLTVPAKKNRLYFQHAQILAFEDVNEFQPYCALHLHTKKDVPQAINPDEFVVHKVFQEHLFHLAGFPIGSPIRLAQLEDRDGGMTYEVVATVMDLLSEGQPDVLRMTCAAWGLPQDISNLTIQKIRQSLGDIFTLQLANKSVEPSRKIRRESEGSGY